GVDWRQRFRSRASTAWGYSSFQGLGMFHPFGFDAVELLAQAVAVLRQARAFGRVAINAGLGELAINLTQLLLQPCGFAFGFLQSPAQRLFTLALGGSGRARRRFLCLGVAGLVAFYIRILARQPAGIIVHVASERLQRAVGYGPELVAGA